MAYGQTLGARALVLLKRTIAALRGEVPWSFEAEIAGEAKGTGLTKLTHVVDAAAAQTAGTALGQERAEAYALARDFRYARRSRRWLIARGWQSRYDRAYVQWNRFTLECRKPWPAIAQMPDQDALALSERPFKDTLT